MKNRTYYRIVTHDHHLIAACYEAIDAALIQQGHPDSVVETREGVITFIRDLGKGKPSPGLIAELIADGIIPQPETD